MQCTVTYILETEFIFLIDTEVTEGIGMKSQKSSATELSIDHREAADITKIMLAPIFVRVIHVRHVVRNSVGVVR